MIDTHAHLDACEAPPGVLLERARAAGVRRVVAVGTGLESARAALDLARVEPDVYAAIGIHPHDAAGRDAARLDELRALLGHEKAVAVGETGLDYVRELAPRGVQARLFAAQLDIARDLGLPVVVHSRGAAEDTAAVLEGFSGRVVLHCFSEPGLLDTALERRFWVSFAGNVTYPKADALREAAARIPADRILAETDSPFLAPQPVRGKPNEPAFVVHTVAALAAARREDPGELAARIEVNAAEVLGLP